MISHEPDHLSDYNAHGVDIVLSGHTHAGQIFPTDDCSTVCVGKLLGHEND